MTAIASKMSAIELFVSQEQTNKPKGPQWNANLVPQQAHLTLVQSRVRSPLQQATYRRLINAIFDQDVDLIEDREGAIVTAAVLLDKQVDLLISQPSSLRLVHTLRALTHMADALGFDLSDLALLGLSIEGSSQ